MQLAYQKSYFNPSTGRLSLPADVRFSSGTTFAESGDGGLSIAKADGTETLALSAGGNLTVAGDATPWGTAGNTLDVTGLINWTRYETTNSQHRPVAWSMLASPQPSGAISTSMDYHGMDIVMASSNANMDGMGSMYALEASTYWAGSTGVPERAVAGYCQAYCSGAGSIGELVGMQIWTRNAGSGTITDAKGVLVYSPLNSGGGTITNLYGIYLEDITTGSNNYAIYSEGGANYFGGSMSIGGALTLGGDANLSRDAANVLSMRNGANAQQFRLYNTYTSEFDHERLAIYYSSNIARIATQAGGSGGSATAMRIGPDGAASLYFQTAGTARWRLDGSGHLLPNTNNSVNIGSASVAPLNIYCGNVFQLTASGTYFTANGDGGVNVKNSGGTNTFAVSSAGVATIGTLKTGTHSAIAAETVTGYIEIQDSGGTTRKVAVVS